MAWMRELTAMGVDVEVITGGPLFGGMRYPLSDLDVPRHDRASSRPTCAISSTRRRAGAASAASVSRCCIPTKSGSASSHGSTSRRRRAAGASRDIVHAHALHQAARLKTDRRAGRDQSSRSAARALHRRSAEGGRPAVATAGARASCRRFSDGQWRTSRRASTRRLFSPEGPNVRAELGLGNAPRRALRQPVSCRSRTSRCSSTRWRSCISQRPTSAPLLVGDGPLESGAATTGGRARHLNDVVSSPATSIRTDCRPGIAPPMCSCCRRTSTTRRTSSSKRWRAGCRLSRRTSAALRDFVESPRAERWCRRATPRRWATQILELARTTSAGAARPARSTGSGRRRSFRGERARSSCSRRITSVLDRRRTRTSAFGVKVADSRRRHVLLHRPDGARACVSRRLGSRAGLSGDGAVRDRLRARRHSARALALRRGVRARAEPSLLTGFLKSLVATAARRSRFTATRIRTIRTASSFSRRRIPNAASRDGLRVSARHARRAPISIFVPPHNAMSKRGLAAVGGGRAEHPRIVSVVPAVDAAVGLHDAGELAARFAVSRADAAGANRIG